MANIAASQFQFGPFAAAQGSIPCIGVIFDILHAPHLSSPQGAATAYLLNSVAFIRAFSQLRLVIFRYKTR